MAANLAV